MNRAPAAAAALLFFAALCGCAENPRDGYSFAQTFRADVKSVAVPAWTNNTFYSGLENKLAQALVSEITKTTPYKVVNNEGAGTRLEGTITSVELRQLSIGRQTGLVQELSLEIVCDFAWKDQRTGKDITARHNFSAARSFVPARGAGERIEVGEDAAVQQLARDVVNEMRSGW